MRRAQKTIVSIILVAVLAPLFLFLASPRNIPERIVYGVSFNTPYARELGLDWKKAYLAILDELEVRHLRLAAHWTMVEPSRDTFNFNELDFQIKEAEVRGADVILGVGRRLPRWPECHVPEWARTLPWEEQKGEIRELIAAVVNRYKNNPVVTYWQVENEPFLGVFAEEQCGALDKAFLDEEIALVKELDPSRPILMTDSGNLGGWAGAYKRGDAFGTSMYLYLWTPELGPFTSVLPPSYYRMKRTAARLAFGAKENFLIELSLEPWLLRPVVEVPLEEQFERMDIEKFNNVIAFAKETGFDRQYLWGAEWWYWLKEQGDDSFWLRAKELYRGL